MESLCFDPEPGFGPNHKVNRTHTCWGWENRVQGWAAFVEPIPGPFEEKPNKVCANKNLGGQMFTWDEEMWGAKCLHGMNAPTLTGCLTSGPRRCATLGTPFKAWSPRRTSPTAQHWADVTVDACEMGFLLGFLQTAESCTCFLPTTSRALPATRGRVFCEFGPGWCCRCCLSV